MNTMFKRFSALTLVVAILLTSDLSIYAQISSEIHGINENNSRWQEILDADLSEPFENIEEITPDENYEQTFDADTGQTFDTDSINMEDSPGQEADSSFDKETNIDFQRSYESIEPSEDIFKIDSAINKYITDRFIIKYANLPDESINQTNEIEFQYSDEIIDRLTSNNLQIIKSARKIPTTFDNDMVVGTQNRENFVTDQVNSKPHQSTLNKSLEVVIETKRETTANEVFAIISESGDEIESIQPDFIMEVSEFDGPPPLGQNNIELELVDFGIEQAKRSTLGDGVVVAVIDTGIDTNHEALRDNLINGWDFYNDDDSVNDSDWYYDQGHGTHITGIIAGGLGYEAEGVAPLTKVMPLKVFQGGIAYTSDIISAIHFAEENGAQIANCSWGTKYENPALEKAIAQSSLLFVCAAGNGLLNNDNFPVYPASYRMDNVISVASVDSYGRFSRFSNFGTQTVDVAAPGMEINGTWFDNGYVTNSGTSMAAAIVSGEAVLILANNQGLSANLIKERIISSSVTVTGLSDKIIGGKMIDASYALSSVMLPNNSVIDIPDDPLPEINPYSDDTSESEFELYGADRHISIKTPMPTSRFGHGVVAVNGLIYAIGGQGGTTGTTYYKKVEVYNPATDTWTTKADMLNARSYFGITVVGSKIYVMGGLGSTGSAISSVEVYDTASTSNTWTTLTSMPIATYGHTANVYNGDIYTAGGYGISTIYKYSLSSSSPSWSTWGYLSKPRFLHCAYVYNGKLYVDSGVSSTASNAKFDDTQNIIDLVSKTSMTTGCFIGGLDAAFAIDGNRIITGGGAKHLDCSTIGTLVQGMAGSTNWYVPSRLLYPRSGVRAAVVDGVAYFIGGIDRDLSILYNTVEAIESGYGYKTALPHSYQKVFSTEMDGNIYLVGGYADNYYSRELHEYNPSTNKWRQLAIMPTYFSTSTPSVSAYGNIYMFGGSKWTNVWEPMTDLWMYNSVTDSWSQVSTAPEIFTHAAFLSGSIYFCKDGANKFYKYNPLTNTWSSAANMPITSPTIRQVSVAGGLLFALCASGTYAFNPATGTWQTKTTTFGSGSFIAPADNAIYELTSAPDNYSNFWRYNYKEDVKLIYRNFDYHGQFYDICPANNKLYVFAGNSSGANSLVEYMPPDSPWTQNLNIYVSKSYSGGATLNNTGYILYGYDSYSRTLSNEFYMVRPNGLEQKTSIPNPARAKAGVVAYKGSVASDDRIFVIGGEITPASHVSLSGTATTTVHAYNPNTNTWVSRASLPKALHSFMSVEYNGKIYVFGGVNGNTVNSDIYEYTISSNTWATKSSSMPSARYGGGAITIGDKIYVIGGAGSKVVQSYDPVANTWSNHAALPEIRSYAGITGADGKIYVIAGTDGTSNATTVFEYNPAFNVWSTWPGIHKAVQGLLAITVDGGMYVFGGETVYRRGSTILYSDLNNMTEYASVASIDGEYIQYGSGRINPSGNLSRTYTDMSYTTPGFNMNFGRTYNSRDTRDTELLLGSKGWRFSFQGKYDLKGNDAVVTLPNGGIMSFKLNADGSYTAKDSRSKLVKSGSTYVLTTKDQYKYEFNSSGYMTKMSDPNANTMTITVNSSGQPTAVTDQAGRVTNIAYTSNRISSITEPAGRIVKYYYDTNNRLNQVTDPVGYSVYYAYDAAGNLISVKDNTNTNVIESFTYLSVDGDPVKKIKSITDQNGNVTTFSYDTAVGSVIAVDTNSRKTTTYYDKNLYPTITIDAAGRIMKNEYELSDGINRYGEAKSVQDANGNTTYYDRDANGNVTRIINPDGSIRTFTYNSLNLPLSETDELGNVTNYAYSGANLTSVSKPNSTNVTSYTYGTVNGIKGLQLTEKNALNNITTYTYDTNGYLKTKKDPIMKEPETYSYNKIGWLKSKTDAEGNLTKYYYDKNGRILKTEHPNGGVERIVYNFRGQITQKISPNIYNSSYDTTTFTTENIVNVVGNYSQTNVGERYSYNSKGQLTSQTDALGNVISYVYDLYNNVTQKTMPNGSVYIYTYDKLNRLLTESFKSSSSGTAQLLNKYEYTDDKNPKTAEYRYFGTNTDDYYKTESTFDYAGRLLQKLNPDGGLEKSIYYKNGLLESSTDANNATTYYEYDSLGRLKVRWTPSSSKTLYTCEVWEYNKVGDVTREIRFIPEQQLWNVTGNSVFTDYVYDNAGRLMSKTDSAGRKSEYEYDDVGNITKNKTYVSGSDYKYVDYTYNSIGKVATEERWVNQKDINGKPDSSTLIALTTEYFYDLNGNLTSVNGPDGVTTSYEYDLLNRLLKQKRPNKNENGTTVTVETSKTYNSMGNVLTQTDERGNITNFSYNQRGFLTKKQFGDAIELYNYDWLGRMTALISPNNYTPRFNEDFYGVNFETMSRTVFEYDSMDRQTKKTEIYKKPGQSEFSEVAAETLTYDRNGNILTKKDAMNNVYQYSYDAANRLKTVKDPLNYVTSYEYDALGRKVKETNAKNIITAYNYDLAGNLLTTTVGGITVLTNTYDLIGNILTSKDANNNITTNEYNYLGKIRQIALPSGTEIPSFSTRLWYDAVGNLTKKNDAISGDIIYTYDNMGKVLTVKDSAGTVTTAYDLAGNPRYVTDRRGTRKTYTYDIFSRVLTESVTVNSKVQTTTWTYDKNGNKKTEKNWRGNEYSFNYDPLDRLIERKDPNGISIEKLEYNDNNLQTKSTDALNHVTAFTYDSCGRLLTTKDALNHTVSQTYDAVGNIATKTDGNSKVTRYEYDNFNRLITVKDHNSVVLSQYQYDNAGNMTRQTDGRGKYIQTAYNVRNLPKTLTDQTGLTETYTYNADGKPAAKVDRKGLTTTYTYSQMGYLLSEKVGSDTVSYTYDNNGNQLTMTDSTGTTTRTYDEQNRVVTKSVPTFGTTTFLYDITTNMAAGFTAEKSTDSRGKETTSIFDKNGRLSQVIDSETGTTTYAYLNNGSIQNVQYPGSLSEEYTYYADNRLQTLTNKSGTVILESFNYGYDNAGNLSQKLDGKGTTTYTYSVLNQLLTVTEPSGKKTTYTYDGAGNRQTETVTQSGQATVTTTCTYDNRGQLTKTVKTSSSVSETYNFSYDNNGNMLSRTPSAAPTMFTATYTYDSRNRMATATENGTTLTYTYNGSGQRIKKQSVLGGTVQFAYEYDKVVQEYDGTAYTRNVYGLNLLARSVGGATNLAYYLYNGHSDVTKLMSTSGSTLASYYYDAFGNITEKTVTVPNNYTYAGYFFDSEVNLYYLKSRFYDARIARFMTEDTYHGNPAYALSLNLYTYCVNNPLIYYDPTGHAPVKEETRVARSVSIGDNGKMILTETKTTYKYGEAVSSTSTKSDYTPPTKSVTTGSLSSVANSVGATVSKSTTTTSSNGSGSSNSSNISGSSSGSNTTTTTLTITNGSGAPLVLTYIPSSNIYTAMYDNYIIVVDKNYNIVNGSGGVLKYLKDSNDVKREELYSNLKEDWYTNETSIGQVQQQMDWDILLDENLTTWTPEDGFKPINQGSNNGIEFVSYNYSLEDYWFQRQMTDAKNYVYGYPVSSALDLLKVCNSDNPSLAYKAQIDSLARTIYREAQGFTGAFNASYQGAVAKNIQNRVDQKYYPTEFIIGLDTGGIYDQKGVYTPYIFNSGQYIGLIGDKDIATNAEALKPDVNTAEWKSALRIATDMVNGKGINVSVGAVTNQVHFLANHAFNSTGKKDIVTVGDNTFFNYR